MRDPIDAPLVLVIFVVAFLVMTLTAVQPRLVFRFLNTFARSDEPSSTIFTVVRTIAGFSSINICIVMLEHFLKR